MNLPEAFTKQMVELLGETEFQQLQEALEESPAVSVRPNLNKTTEAKSNTPIPWSSLGYYLSERPNFTLNPKFHAGAFYVQEASSMFIEQALRQCGEPHVVLDLCAAPGGKSTLLRTLLPDDALLVSNEPMKPRAHVLAENITKWGHEGCVVTCNYPRDFKKLGPIFDVIAVDAPCSGEGMFRKDNPALEMWSIANVSECAERQREIVESIWPTLKEGGYLIYSTCTYNTAENEENVAYFCDTLGAEVIEIPTKESWNITGNLLKGSDFPVYHFMPHKTRGEGFFLALLRKTASTGATKYKGKTNFNKLPKEWSKAITQADMLLTEREDVGYAVRKDDAPLISHLLTTLYPLHIGLPLYELKGRKTIPHHALTMSRLLAKEAYPTIELSADDALNYLRRQAVSIDAPRGYVLVTYDKMPLGFANNLGNRANNMYPQNWKIRH